MKIERLDINGVWLGQSPILADERGQFREWFKAKDFSEATGRKFDVQQSNISSSKKGALRGIHYSIAQEGQGKWVTCVVGSIWDVVVDIRPSSPTYKKWIGMELSEGDGKSIFVSEGLGHAFISLEENSVVSYLLTTAYSSSEEFDINPFDPELAIEWPKSLTPIMSAKDSSAPSLCARFLEGKLPS